ncbi:MAG: tetratricopeptide repeat protein [Spirochaetes bacterium]|nr:tetratricopeptide repeat protein [Spirochaetota bacterium]
MQRMIIVTALLSIVFQLSCGAGYYYRKGVELDDRKEYDEAMQYYDRAVASDPAYVRAYNDRGVIRKNRKAYEEAVADFDKAIELDATFAKAYINRGNCHMAQRRYDRAIEDYDRAIAVEPSSAVAHYNRGNGYLKKRMLRKADEDFARAAEIDPGFYRTHYNRAYIYGLLYDGKSALAHFEKAVRAALANADDAAELDRHLSENPGNLAIIRGSHEFSDLMKELRKGPAKKTEARQAP